MKKPFRLFPVLVAIGLILAACGGQATTAAPQPTEAPAATEAPAPTEAPAATEAPTEAPAPTAEAPAEPKVLRLRIQNDIDNLDPAFWPVSVDEMTMVNIAQGLVGYKPGTWEVVNVLADSIEQSADGLTIDFKLKEGIQFQKGYGEVTAEDVKFSFERFLDPDLAATFAGDWKTLDHVEVTGTYTGQIILKEPFAPLWTTTLPLGSGFVLSKKALEEMGAAAFGTSPVGTGPYEFTEWIPNQHVLLTRFDDYWGPKPEWDQIELIPIIDDSAGEIALEAGEVDFGRVSPESFSRFQGNSDFTATSAPTLDYEWLNVNVANPKLQDKNVRLAIRYGINADDIIQAAHGGLWQRACAIIAPGQIGYWADAPCYERDVQKAKDYLQQAGLTSLDLTLMTDSSEEAQAAAEVIQAQLAEVGINITIQPADGATFYTLGEQLRDRELTYVFFNTNPDPSWTVVWFLCNQNDEWNWTYYCNPELDKLADDAVKELDPAKRNEDYIKIQQIWDEDAVAFDWIAYPTNYYVARAGLKPVLTPHGRWLAYAFTSE